MRVRARDVKVEDAPADVAAFVTPGQVFVKSGTPYVVYAMALFSGQLLLQIVDDLKYPSWLPSWLFDVDEPTVPGDWVCTLSQEQPTMIQGPAFVAGSLDQYSRMVELEDEQVQKFWAHVESTERP